MHYTDNLELQWAELEHHRHSEFQWFHKSVQYVDELFKTDLWTKSMVQRKKPAQKNNLFSDPFIEFNLLT